MMADSGTSLNMLPDVDYYKIKNHFFADKHCVVLPNTLTACDCTEEEQKAVPDIRFKIDGKEYLITRDQWYERGSTGKCAIKFMHGPGMGFWILGVNFFTNYYSVFDYENMRIGFAESVKFGNAQSKTFIRWAFSGTFLQNL